MAIRIARARALNADSALTHQPGEKGILWKTYPSTLHVVVVLPPDQIDVQCHTCRKGKRLQQVGDHFRGHCRSASFTYSQGLEGVIIVRIQKAELTISNLLPREWEVADKVRS